jgi:hypothetical protein
MNLRSNKLFTVLTGERCEDADREKAEEEEEDDCEINPGLCNGDREGKDSGESNEENDEEEEDEEPEMRTRPMCNSDNPN